MALASAAVVVGLAAGTGLAPVSRSTASIVLVFTLVGAVALHRRVPDGFLVTASTVSLLFLVTSWPPTVSVLVGCGAGLVSSRFRTTLRGSFAGTVRQPVRVLLWTLVLAVPSVVVVHLWLTLWAPPLAHAHTPEVLGVAVPRGVVAVVGALANAAAEEVLWRVAAFRFLSRSLPVVPSVLLQAVAFGVTHVAGYPPGWFGVVSTSMFGVAAVLVVRSTKLLAPALLAHAAADLVIIPAVLR